MVLRPANGWDEVLCEEFTKPYYLQLEKLIENELNAHTVYPPFELIFRALNTVAFEAVKVVIIGQDPYHGVNQANGIAFAVNNGITLPPSLKNIYAEIESDLGVKMPKTGTLTGWAQQGVLLLNTSLTVRSAEPMSHSQFGWTTFTDAVIHKCAQSERPKIFMLWGAGAIAKKRVIAPRHLVLTAPHPSPLSAYRGFFGCAHFSKANDFLLQNSITPVDWTDTDSTEDKPYYRSQGSVKVLI